MPQRSTSRQPKQDAKRDRPADPVFERLLQQLQQEQEAHELAYQRLMNDMQALTPLERAERWLRYVSESDRDFGVQEALVYLVSRGQDCSKLIKEMLVRWKQAESQVIKAYQDGWLVEDLDTNTFAREGQRPDFNPEDVETTSSLDLPNFWVGNDYQDLSLDATMLRTAEWCDIGGFDMWWRRLATEQYEGIIREGAENVPAAYYLFNFARSNYAIQHLPKSLGRLLEAIRLPEYRQPYPWRIVRWHGETPKKVDHFAFAASLVFSTARLHPQEVDDPIVRQALETLLRYQSDRGAWRCWADDQDSCIRTTAMAVHALALLRPRGWEISTSAAADWLWSIQRQDGSWMDPGWPDSVYLSVLVLDALELAAKGTRTTFYAAALTVGRTSAGPIQVSYHSCFISYSSRDAGFAEKLHADLESKGVECWFAPEDMRIGDKIRQRIDDEIWQHAKLLLVLSKDSVTSDWVEGEVEAAFEKERSTKATVLFPIRLDDAVMSTEAAWAAEIRRTRNIGDFTRWRNADVYIEMLARLVRDLETGAADGSG